MKKKKKKSLNKLLLFVIFVVIVIAFCCSFSLMKKNNVKDTILGKWTTDEVTVYQFNKDNTGKLIVPLSEYEFTYKIEGDKLYIDFVNEKSEDSEYTYFLKDSKLNLKGKNGTFIFKRYVEK